jgi:predicted AlkP superfamily pyrophosphatase or phosphodiesterase
MKKINFLILTFVILFVFISCENPPKTKRVIIIGLDGLSVEGYRKSNHPNLDKLLEDGVLSLNTRCVMPSVTLPNWTSHLTSGGPEQHGVMGNDWKVDSHKLSPVEQDDAGYYPSIFKILKEQVPNVQTAYYYNWSNLINSVNKQYLDAINFEKNDEYSENYGRAYDFIIKNKAKPTLVFLYSVHIDHAGHDYNWMSPEYINAIEEVDAEIGNFINELKSSGLYNDTNFLLITDHGGTRSSGHGGLSKEEMEVPWGITGPGVAKGKILDEPNSNANTARVIAFLFGCNNIPKSWIGKVPESVFVQ